MDPFFRKLYGKKLPHVYGKYFHNGYGNNFRNRYGKYFQKSYGNTLHKIHDNAESARAHPLFPTALPREGKQDPPLREKDL